MSVFVIGTSILESIREIAPDLPLRGTAYPLVLDESVIRDLEEAEYLVTPTFSFPQIKDLIPNVKWIQSVTAGVEDFIQPLRNSPIVLSRFVGTLPSLMAEYVICHIISHERGFRRAQNYQDERKWGAAELMDYRRLSNLSVCVLGFGTIGKRVAKYCKFIGLWVRVVRNTIAAPCPDVDEFFDSHNISRAMEGVDYVVNVLPSTDKTVKLLSGDALSVCRGDPSAVLINIGRGDIIDEDSILRALEQNWISAAILDVFEREPLPEGSPLWAMDNVCITPHVSGFSHRAEVAREFVDNYNSIQRGEVPANVVNCHNGY